MHLQLKIYIRRFEREPKNSSKDQLIFMEVKMRKLIMVLITGLIVLSISGSASSNDTLVVGVAPFTDPQKIEKSFKPLAG